MAADAASENYQAGKARAAEEVGWCRVAGDASRATTQAELDAIIDDLNADARVDGMLVQLPVPISSFGTLIAGQIHPDKDVDGFSPVERGRLCVASPATCLCVHPARGHAAVA